MSYPVVKGVSYTLAHSPNLLLYHGTTQTMDRAKNPQSEYLKKLPESLRTYEEVVSYLPNQVYIGNINPDKMNDYTKPWYENPVENSNRKGKMGDILPEDEFYGLIKIADAFGLVNITKEMTGNIKETIKDNPFYTEEDIKKLGEGGEEEEIKIAVRDKIAEPLYHEGNLIGCVKRAHDIDQNLNAHVILENLATKASAIITLRHLIKDNGIDPEEIDYIIETSEEACGDMNQRGGGNFAKAIGELAWCNSSTGSDVRGFCAAPAHGIVTAAGLVKSGVFKNVVVLGGGSIAKLGMNGKSHLDKNMPVLEDVLGGFAVLISENDGESPIIRTDLIGKHNVGSGSSPQNVIQAVVYKPLEDSEFKLTDIDKYSVEMQNPEITEPAGAGNVPLANYKMIAALGVKKGELEKKDLLAFTQNHGMPGFAPTQGHIPSGVPYLGFAWDEILKENINRAMIIGKGSLFLGRMTNLFDGISFIMEKNPGDSKEETSINKEELKKIMAETIREMAEKL